MKVLAILLLVAAISQSEAGIRKKRFMVDGIKEKLNKGKDFIGDQFSKAKNETKNLFGEAKDKVKNVLGEVKDEATKVKDKLLAQSRETAVNYLKSVEQGESLSDDCQKIAKN